MKLRDILAASAASVVLAGTLHAAPAFAAYVDDGIYTISASLPGQQTVTTVPGATTFTNGTTFENYTGSLTINNPGVTITGGGSSPSTPGDWSTNPWTGTSASSTESYIYGGGGSSSVTFSFTSPQSYFGFLWGSTDLSNTVTFSNGSNVVDQITGAELVSYNIGAGAYPDAGSFVGFSADNTSADFTQVVLSDTSYPFESADHASVSAVPLPGALPLFGTAIMGLMGFGMRRKKSAKTTA